ncbi:MAG: YwaF family protein [Clostridia bacterium]|nr:YwaF family protein [Clostridia bacterium]
MFNTQHILYMVISAIISAGLLVFFALRVKEEKTKIQILKIFAIVTVIIHYSDLWYGFFANGGEETISSTHILPVYPCNVMMWLLLVASLIKNKNSLAFRVIAEFCSFGGIVCGFIGILLNANFDANPTLADYYVLKGMLSHSTMLFGCIYLIVGKFIKIRVFNALSITLGLATFVVCGLLVNGLYSLFGMESPDGMFLNSNPYFPVSPILLGLVAILFLFGVLALYERRLPLEERWYYILKKKFKK